MNSNQPTANIVRIDGFGQNIRWAVESARQVQIGEQVFWNLRVRPLALVGPDGSDTLPVTGPVETLNLY